MNPFPTSAARSGSPRLAVALLPLLAPLAAASGTDADPAPSPPADEEDRMAELEAEQEEMERKLDVLAGEIERLRLGEVAPPVGDRFAGLGPAASKIYAVDQGLSIGGYGEVLYESFHGDGDELDFLRAILYFGYKFNESWVLNTEIEIEHADEIFLEFATIDYLYEEWLNFRVGMLLIPMGFLNELHEPTTFLSARRPDVESFIIPSTWRENGLGVFGEACDFSYRAYLVNGFEGTAFGADSGLRGGRQKGSQAASDDFGAVARVDWMGIPGITLGGSYYFGHSGQDVGVNGDVSIYEAHAEASWRGVHFRGLYSQARVDDVLGLNQGNSDLTDNMGMFINLNESVGEELEGGYLELGYDVLAPFSSTQSVTPFVRWEVYDLQKNVPAPFVADGSRDVRVTTLGVAWAPIPNLIFKADVQDINNEAGTGVDQVNVAAGYVF